MEVAGLEQLISLRPFNDMNNVTINKEGKCILANRCFVKLAEVYNMPVCRIPTHDSISVNSFKFSLNELLYSPFHYKHLQYQYLLPRFIFQCIESAKRKNRTCYYCYIHKNAYPGDLNMDIFVPTTGEAYVVIGLRIRDYWRTSFTFV
ncbi:F15L conserved protein [Western grey kangaroopox virus]|uniref:F15L conserved protein n=2 Tax=Macropopoxvirus TaxID=2733295 RepID=A0A2C9DSZ9_9POXV|nr:F15L conserved protein [Western grey kangaroopox virus]YP_010085322.1 F15L conserved protein [Eastern grey kangaroopox virus]ATI20968.1 F15L conserved protein [Western grey kangaroopox virus]ATI21132.1 F15L conserved protein [Eastern grey kangaroopox virus]ATX75031.1 F15L conserved protein [Eastern grey kangaroopox virus]